MFVAIPAEKQSKGIVTRTAPHTLY